MTVLTKIATGPIWSFQLTMTAMDLTIRLIVMIQDASIYPGAPEVENDGIDQDCDVSDLIILLDLDGDGFDETDCVG